MGCDASRPQRCGHQTKLVNGVCEACQTFTGTIQSKDGYTKIGHKNNLYIEKCGPQVSLKWKWDGPSFSGKDPDISQTCTYTRNGLTDCKNPDGGPAYYSIFKRDGDWGTEKALSGSWTYGDLWDASSPPPLRACYGSWDDKSEQIKKAVTPTQCNNYEKGGKWKREGQTEPTPWP